MTRGLSGERIEKIMLHNYGIVSSSGDMLVV
jgi:hypothetical protein